MAEFARAVVQRKIQRKQPDIRYFGIVKESHRETISALEEQVFLAWDNGPDAPPRARVREESSTPRLGILLWNNDAPKFPDSVLTKFAPGTSQHKEIKKLQSELESMWPASSASVQSPTRATVNRASGLPDFTGEDPLDLTREVDLEQTAADDFNVEQLLDIIC